MSHTYLIFNVFFLQSVRRCPSPKSIVRKRQSAPFELPYTVASLKKKKNDQGGVNPTRKKTVRHPKCTAIDVVAVARLLKHLLDVVVPQTLICGIIYYKAREAPLVSQTCSMSWNTR